ncbi:MAG TPA: methyltransferase domain-containing protein [Spongiibacteraceae bacterium]|nr:methyltransferase domain-containing protein [Spongiibacteraceae bacterium]
MNRRDHILAGIDRASLGLEIAPWFSPLAPKREGFNVRTLDVFDFETQMSRARQDPEIAEESYDNIEAIDYIGSACDIARIVPAAEHGSFDYIVSSHNFEHLPDPIKFLQGCETLLKPGGLLSMAVPDLRGCFDYFRPWTVTADWIEAFVEGREKPSQRQLFISHSSDACVIQADGVRLGTFPFDQAIERIEHRGGPGLAAALKARLADWQADTGAGYVDCHCSAMTPSSLELMLLDCQMLGLIGLEIESIESSGEFEFYVRLRRAHEPLSVDDGTYTARRNALMRQILIERKQAINDGTGEDRTPPGGFVAALRQWNRARVRRRRTRLAG